MANTSSRFVVATHVLSVLALKRLLGVEPTKSDELAYSADTNPVVIRRIVGQLREAGLVESQSGPHGGTVLSCAPERITLLDVQRAVDSGSLFHMHYGCPHQGCPVGGNIQDSLGSVIDEARTAVDDVLASRTLAAIVDDLLQRSGLTPVLRDGIRFEELWSRFEFKDGLLVEKEAV